MMLAAPNLKQRKAVIGEVSERSKVPDSKSGVVQATGGSNPPLSAGWLREEGEVTERPKVHDWKSCVSQGTAGSNPALSAATFGGLIGRGSFGAIL